jgi:hypothetical protein
LSGPVMNRMPLRMHSFLNSPIVDSAKALSYASPTFPAEALRPSDSSASPNLSRRHCKGPCPRVPVFRPGPAPERHLQGVSTMSCPFRGAPCQPTIARENTSIAKATYTKPAHVVGDPHGIRPGRGEVRVQQIRSPLAVLRSRTGFGFPPRTRPFMASSRKGLTAVRLEQKCGGINHYGTALPTHRILQHDGSTKKVTGGWVANTGGGSSAWETVPRLPVAGRENFE